MTVYGIGIINLTISLDGIQSVGNPSGGYDLSASRDHLQMMVKLQYTQ